MAFVFGTRVSVVLEDILLLHLEGSYLLLSQPLLVLQLLLLSLEVFVCLSCLRKLLIHKLVLASQGLDVFGEFRAFGLLDVDDLSLVFDLLSEGLVLLPKELDFVFPLKKTSLELIFFA